MTRRAGIFFLVVGASGVGKDTLLDGARAALAGDARFVFAQRTITRPADAGGEAHHAVTLDEFAAQRDANRFLLHWSAHDLHYGLPVTLAADIAAGRHVVANGSRATIAELAGRVADLVVVEITAPPEVIAKRLEGRGRESGSAIEGRKSRRTPPFPNGVEVVRVVNDTDAATGIARLTAVLIEYSAAPLRVRALPIDTWRDHIVFLAKAATALNANEYLGPSRVEIAGLGKSVRASVNVIDDATLLGADEIGLSPSAYDALGLPEGAAVRLKRTPSPESSEALRAKLRGDELSEGQIKMLIGDIVAGRYPDREVAAFLVSATRGLSDNEVLALARARLEFAEKITWDEPIVVDKHSMGGIPGSRITMIVVPLVAAHGLAVPKTSSRAITSAAGTADAMETLARVDLSVADVHRVVAEARGCVAWNGRLNHSPVDDVMNAITRPLGIDSTRWSVASILSKKVAAGSTHVIVDLPYGPQAKMKTRAEAEEVGRLFEAVGRGLGLVVEAIASDGSQPIGRGIGPALEVRDVLAVLNNEVDAPSDLRDKALYFASRILAWDPNVGSEAAGLERAKQLLASGAARAALERIVDAQGRRQPRVMPGVFVRKVVAGRSGIVASIDGWAIAGIARRAGAPQDQSAGLDLQCRVGDAVQTGDALYAIHAESPGDADAAHDMARHNSGFTIRD